MPKDVVDLSARSEILRNEPWHLHFWELTPTEFAEQLRNPRTFLRERLGIALPDTCAITSDVVNHDWISAHSDELRHDNGTVICNIGGGNVALAVYRITSYGHTKDMVGKYAKQLLHDPSEQKVKGT